jgi:hypothetical protein
MTHDQNAAAVSKAAQAYAKAASSLRRPLEVVEKSLLDAVAKLIRKTVTAAGLATAPPVTAPLPFSTPPTDAPSVVPVNAPRPIDSPDNDD